MLEAFPVKCEFAQTPTDIPRCLAVHRVCFPFGLKLPMKEVAKGSELMRLNTIDPVQDEGSLISVVLAYHGLRQFDVLLPPLGYALHQKGTEQNRMAKIAASKFG